jgi:hypothetical protein|tara:strand:+ start:93 stop:329 length:237 start_codon:yes stop_codon:yes gene_type:complete
MQYDPLENIQSYVEPTHNLVVTLIDGIVIYCDSVVTDNSVNGKGMRAVSTGETVAKFSPSKIISITCITVPPLPMTLT